MCKTLQPAMLRKTNLISNPKLLKSKLNYGGNFLNFFLLSFLGVKMIRMVHVLRNHPKLKFDLYSFFFWNLF